MELNKLLTETRNSASINLDKMSSQEIVELMNKEDYKVIEAVNSQQEQIAKAIDAIVAALQQGGRLFYIGAGTSGRLGVLDASECPPTFNTNPNLVIGLIAGGDTALRTAAEGAEDSLTGAKRDLEKYDFNSKDILVGLAASGRTPYVLGGLKYAKGLGSVTIAISCTEQAKISSLADIPIELLVGPEILTGSTRLKSGTAQKLVLNMLSTGTMVRLGKCYSNLMVDVQPTNEKLKVRAENMVMEVTGVSRETAQSTLQLTNGRVKPALVMLLKHCSLEETVELAEVAVKTDDSSITASVANEAVATQPEIKETSNVDKEIVWLKKSGPVQKGEAVLTFKSRGTSDKVKPKANTEALAPAEIKSETKPQQQEVKTAPKKFSLMQYVR